MMHKSWIVLLVTMVLALGACMPVTPTAQTSPLSEPAAEGTPTPAAEATEAPTEEATEEATAEATVEATQEPAAETGSEDVDMGALVRQILAQQLQLNLDQVEIVSVEKVEWPDACLGVYTADMMCAQVITPGYLVILSVDGQQYEYHTNLDGNFVQLATAPEANIGDVLIDWQQTLDTCQSAQFGRDGVVFGPCMGVRMGGKLVSSERENELADFVATYAPFESETPAGIVTFNGAGSTEATPAEQRMIAEWARQAALEASAGRSGASWGLAFAWHREGGIAGFCDDLTVYVTGQLFASSCKGQTAQTISSRRMSAEELEQVYTWIDTYSPFEYIHDDGPVADSMEVRMVFSGAGSTQADEPTQQEIVAFASALYAQEVR
ncbi:MAG: hypothetical protein IT328_17190 [Caldilineaceae bacterium]|nr:hypothetical protein [Caldilineaceae bacterium]